MFLLPRQSRPAGLSCEHIAPITSRSWMFRSIRFSRSVAEIFLMKILKKGKPQVGWAIEWFCTGSGNGNGGCRALLLVEQDDVFKTSSSHYDGGTETYCTFRCAECGVWTDIPKNNVPFKVRHWNRERDGTATGEKLMER